MKTYCHYWLLCNTDRNHAILPFSKFSFIWLTRRKQISCTGLASPVWSQNVLLSRVPTFLANARLNFVRKNVTNLFLGGHHFGCSLVYRLVLVAMLLLLNAIQNMHLEDFRTKNVCRQFESQNGPLKSLLPAWLSCPNDIIAPRRNACVPFMLRLLKPSINLHHTFADQLMFLKYLLLQVLQVIDMHELLPWRSTCSYDSSFFDKIPLIFNGCNVLST